MSAELLAELASLKRKLSARERAGNGYFANIEAIKARIAEIEQEISDE